jgi:hypothetical protein
MPSSDSILIGKILFSRCLEAGHWPDKIQFTKYLYLIDYCQCRYKAEQATDIDWIFYHYGPWSPDASSVMNNVQDHFRLGWRDFTEDDDREFYGFDPIRQRLSISLEGFILKIIQYFKTRDVTDLIDFCYKQTEPMLNAHRGERLDFSVIPTSKEMPLFKAPSATTEMPQLSSASEQRIAAYKAKAERLKAKAKQWRSTMDTAEYGNAMERLEQERQSDLPNLHGRTVKLNKESVQALNELTDE